MITVADTDILSMFGKANAISILKSVFKELYAPIAVYEELLRAKDVGFSFVDDILNDLEIISLGEEECKEYVVSLKSERYLHKGELQGIIICKHRKGILLTNDKMAKNFCKNNEILYFDIKGILRILFLKDVLNEKETRKLASEIEEKDNTTIKDFEEIFRK
jgi:predicted nucleic acid-binding protein